jgi:hypothetical protein
MIMQTEELPKAQVMPKVFEKSPAEGAATTTPPTASQNADYQLDNKSDTTAGRSAGTDDILENHTITATPECPKSWRLLVIVTALCLAVFLVALDQTIVAVATPKITDHFHSLDDVGWYVCHRSSDFGARQPAIQVR